MGNISSLWQKVNHGAALTAISYVFVTNFVVLDLLAQNQETRFLPLEDMVYLIEPKSPKLKGGGLTDLAFFGDFVTWNKWTYTSIRRTIGACNQKLSGTANESKAFNFSWGTTTTAGGKIAGGPRGNGTPSPSVEFSVRTAKTLGIDITSTESFSLACECEKKQGFSPIVTVKYLVTEYSGIYSDWQWFSSKDYEFHAHFRKILGYDCYYDTCDEVSENAE